MSNNSLNPLTITSERDMTNKQTEIFKLQLALGVSSPGRERMIENLLSQATANPLAHPEMGTKKRSPLMKKVHTTTRTLVKNLFVTIFIGILLAACSGVPTPDLKSNSEVPQVYLVDGVAHSPSQMQKLAIRNADLYYAVTPEAFAQGQAYVFTKQADYLNFKNQYKTNVDQTLSAQTSCWTDLDTKSSLYKNTSYSGSVLKLVKGSSYDRDDLGSFDQAISSVKGACNVWTDLYDNGDFTGIPWSTFGTNYSSLPSWINNDASSVKVGQ
jgi:hypothetical protein